MPVPPTTSEHAGRTAPLVPHRLQGNGQLALRRSSLFHQAAAITDDAPMALATGLPGQRAPHDRASPRCCTERSAPLSHPIARGPAIAAHLQPGPRGRSQDHPDRKRSRLHRGDAPSMDLARRRRGQHPQAQVAKTPTPNAPRNATPIDDESVSTPPSAQKPGTQAAGQVKPSPAQPAVARDQSIQRRVI